MTDETVMLQADDSKLSERTVSDELPQVSSYLVAILHLHLAYLV